MKEILLTSSVLILALLLLRLLFRKTISRRVQYALWGLVALRLLVPVSLPAMEHNVLTAAEPVTARITAPALYVTPYRETIVSAPPGVFQTPAPYQSFRVDTATEDSTVTFTDGKNITHSIEYKSQIPLTPVLKAVWHAGMAVMAVWFLLANLRFLLRLRRSDHEHRRAGLCKRAVRIAVQQHNELPPGRVAPEHIVLPEHPL